MPAPFQVWHDLTESENLDLSEDIAANGVMVPIVLDGEGRILDGHHRFQIAESLGIDCPFTIVEIENDEQGRSIAYRLNAHRRHATREQKRAALERSLLADPQLSDREHAKRVGVSHPTAAKVRDEMEQSGRLEELSSSTGADGRTRRRPLIDMFDEATPAATKAIERIVRLAADDRFTRNADQVATKHRSDLIRARDALTGVIDLLTQGEA